MPPYLGEPDEPNKPHWCIVMVPEDESATVTFMQNADMKNLTQANAAQKAAELNAKLGH